MAAFRIFLMYLIIASPFDGIVDFFEKGGLAMIPLAICSMVAVTIVILRAFSLRRESVLPRVVEGEIERLAPGASPDSILQLVREDPAALSCLTRTALDHLRVPRADNTEAVQTRARREIMRLESGLPVLELIVGISPLLGLLGAVLGLVKVFQNLGSGKEAVDTLAIALGISEALYTTIFGLAIAVPTLVAYTYFARKVEGMSVEMESLMAELLSKCYFRKTSRPPAPPNSPDAGYAGPAEPYPVQSPLSGIPSV